MKSVKKYTSFLLVASCSLWVIHRLVHQSRSISSSGRRNKGANGGTNQHSLFDAGDATKRRTTKSAPRKTTASDTQFRVEKRGRRSNGRDAKRAVRSEEASPPKPKRGTRGESKIAVEDNNFRRRRSSKKYAKLSLQSNDDSLSKANERGETKMAIQDRWRQQHSNRSYVKQSVHSDGSPVKPNANNNNKPIVLCNRKGKPPKEVTIPEFYQGRSKCSHYLKETVTFFHLGKAGGGTVHVGMAKHRTRILSDHPKPKSSHIKLLQQGPSETLVVPVRDPVDRFVSAFRWRLVVLCAPDDARAAQRLGAAHRPHEVCKTSAAKREEERTMRETYGSDPNALAEALCEGSPARRRAAEDYARVGHSMPLSEWLEFLIDPEMIDEISDEGIERVYALPLEKQGDGQKSLFEQHIEQLQLHLLRSRYDEETVKAIRERPRAGEIEANDKWEHSSVKFYNSTKTAKEKAPPSSLSSLGECCLTRHLRKDYRIIQTMLLGEEDNDSSSSSSSSSTTTGESYYVNPLTEAHPAIRKACSWGSREQQELCRSDLRSMLSRRARYLDLSMGTCSKVVNTK